VTAGAGGPEPAAAWAPDPAAFVRDLEAKPEALVRLGASGVVARAIAGIPPRRRVLLLGMGSSRYAAEVAALRLRRAGIDAVAELASVGATTPPSPDLLVVGISASGRSAETLTALERYVGRSPTVALTNEAGSPLGSLADVVVPLEAGVEQGGVACRTFQHTGLVLRQLEAHMLGRDPGIAGLCERVAGATAELLLRRPDWLPATAAALDGPDGVAVIAPAERSSSAAQGALMVREGPRRQATASETGDWNHVDVYLTKTLDYRALLFTGSPFDGAVMEWCRSRSSTVVAVGAELPGAALTLRYRGDADEDVAIHTETLVAELVASAWWSGGTGRG
jgi:D-arabinose 5-phosphate isomerase GutQ